jgi:hypothetical protein
VLAYLEGFVGVPYSQLAPELGENDDLAAVHLEAWHVEESAPANNQEALIDSLTRFLRGSSQEGLGSRLYWETNVIGALSSWSVAWGAGPRLDRVKALLFAATPPQGWIPQASGDPILLEVFKRAQEDS